MKDRALLDALEGYGNAVLLTCDRNLPFQQRLAGRRVGIVILSGQRLSVLVPHLTSIAHAVAEANPGSAVAVDASGKVARVIQKGD